MEEDNRLTDIGFIKKKEVNSKIITDPSHIFEIKEKTINKLKEVFFIKN